MLYVMFCMSQSLASGSQLKPNCFHVVFQDYMAPEVVVCPDKHKPSDHKEMTHLVYTHLIDAWAVGVLAYELIVGKPPFDKVRHLSGFVRDRDLFESNHTPLLRLSTMIQALLPDSQNSGSGCGILSVLICMIGVTSNTQGVG